MPSDKPIIALENVAYATPDGKSVLNGVNLELFPEQTVCLRGKNGSGKTTLFRCLTGLNKIAGGEIRHEGKPARSNSDFEALRRDVGYVLQDPDNQIIFPQVLEDVSFGPINLGFLPKEAEAAAREALAAVGLSGFEERLGHELSGGEKRLAALAAILAMKPRALLLDEPLNELDDEACARVCEVIAKIKCAKIIVSHDPAIFPANAATYELADGVVRKVN